MAFPTGWGRKCIITIPAMQISGNNSNFTALITEANLPAEMVDGGVNSALNGGGDVRLSEDLAGAVQIPLDVVRFLTGSTPNVEMYTKIPTVNAGTDKLYTVWYKKSGEVQPPLTDPMGRNAVWSQAELVCLMETATPIDRTGNHTLTFTGTLTSINGPFGKANSFAGSDRLSNTDAALKDILTTYNTTVSIISRRPAYANPFGVLSWDGTDDYILYPMDNIGGNGSLVFWRDLGGIIINNNAESLATTWIHNSFTTRATNNHELYTNGVSSGTSTLTGSTGPFTTFFIGGYKTQNWDGDIAQVIVWKTARTNNWLITEYNNQSNPAAFGIAGTPQAVGGGASASLMVNSGSSLHIAANIIMTQMHAISVTSASHNQTAGSITLWQVQTLGSANSTHSLGSIGPILSQGFSMITQDAAHGVASVDVTIFQLQVLVIQNATHGLGSQETGLFISTVFTPYSRRTNDAVGAGRISPPTSADRSIQPTNNRTLRI